MVTWVASRRVTMYITVSGLFHVQYSAQGILVATISVAWAAAVVLFKLVL